LEREEQLRWRVLKLMEHSELKSPPRNEREGGQKPKVGIVVN